MTLAVGTRLGPYEILAPLGAGGMGEVYRARDSRLDRAVAIKVLPERLSGNADSLARFEREARAVAALSHPNILSIFDFGAEGGRAYAAMELLEGQTLRERLSEGPLPPRKAAEIGAQIAHGLAAAHEKGIVHRDLKPENIFLTRDGRAKILDFGLARTEAGSGSSSQLAAAPTVRPSATDPGTVLGTAAYMSPEQVRGEVADARSDVFSFGAVFYELLTGRQAFHRATAAETMTAILREEPAAVESLVAGVPPVLDRVVHHCLEKNPLERFQSARDLGFALDGAAGGTSSGGSRVVADRARRGRRGIMVASVLALAGLGAGFLAGRLATGAGDRTETSTPVTFTRITEAPGMETEPTLSPDGKSVVYVSDGKGKLNLCLQRIGSRNPVVLTAESGADDRQPAFSPDGERIAFRSEREGGGIFLMSASGESVRRLTDFGYFPSWSPDGREIVISVADFLFPDNLPGEITDLWAINVETGAKRAVLLGQNALQPSWSPHGQRIAFWGLRKGTGQRDLFTVAADGSEVHGGKEVTHDPPLDWSPAWAPDGRSLYFSSNRGGTMNLWRLSIDEGTGRVRGAPSPVTTPSVWSGRVSFSRDGQRFAYASVDWRTNLMRVPFDPRSESVTGPAVSLFKATLQIRDFQLSPDGQWIAFSQASAREDLYVSRIDGTEYRRLTDDRFRERTPVWSPDGRRLVFYSDRSGIYQLWTINVDGSGLEQLVKTPGAAVIFPAFSPDGRQVSAVMTEGSKGWPLIDLEHRPTPAVRWIPSPNPGASFWPFTWSPDGKRLVGALRRDDGTMRSLAVYDLAAGKYTILPPTPDPYFKSALWLNDGVRLLVRGVNGVSLVNTQSGSRRLLIPVRGYFLGVTMGVPRDNRSITYNETGSEGDIWLAEMSAAATGPSPGR